MISLEFITKRYKIPLHEFKDCIEATLNYQVSPEDMELLTPVLMNEFSYSLISDTPNSNQIEVPETGIMLSNLNFMPEQFIKVKSAFYKYYMVKHTNAIDLIITQWREHCDVELSWALYPDDPNITILFKPKPLAIDIDNIVIDLVEKLIEEDKFIPYKYLRVLRKL